MKYQADTEALHGKINHELVNGPLWPTSFIKAESHVKFGSTGAVAPQETMTIT